MHFECGGVDQETRPDELVELTMLAEYVADVLAEKALDTLAKLLHAVYVGLLHAPGAVGRIG